MRSDKISIDETKQIMQTFFSCNFNFQYLTDQLKNKRQKIIIIQCVQNNLRSLLLSIEAELFSAKLINALKIYDNINITRIMQHICNLNQILSTPNVVQDFWAYYKYKEQFMTKSRGQNFDIPINDVTSQKKLLIYEKFMSYFQQRGLFQICNKIYFKVQLDIMSQSSRNNLQNRQINSIYSTVQIKKIFIYYQEMQGDLNLVSKLLEENEFTFQKCNIQNIKRILAQYLTLGLVRIFKISNNLDQFAGCSWDRFQQINKRLMKNFTFEEKQIVLRVGIYNNVEDKDIINICGKMSIRYRPVGFTKWQKEFQKESKLYKAQKQLILGKIQKQMKIISKNDNSKNLNPDEQKYSVLQ